MGLKGYGYLWPVWITPHPFHFFSQLNGSPKALKEKEEGKEKNKK